MDACFEDIPTSIPYLARAKLYETEKPFSADFPTDHIKGAVNSNHVYSTHRVIVSDARRTNPFSLEQNGFCFLKYHSQIPSEDLELPDVVMSKYFPELVDLLQKEFPFYRQIIGLNYQIRKRSPAFPSQPGKETPFEQPANLPHSDFDRSGALTVMKRHFPDDQDFLETASFDMIGVWRVLRGPNDDWPLALCDYNSVDIVNDTISNDSLHHDYVGENLLLHPNKDHAWWYISHQDVDDLVVFRNSSSKITVPICFHTAFCKEGAGGPPRESIELRFVGFR